ncbi:hypothetical protein DFP94_11039 [Fontibacillus phaseoli]|uniref:Uncharacterized protein n=1 Tax=Fontibacillus phaseoli TaxID=1416533 RepID=A0A369B632_9BACL|nr:hypothetical protein DFP94_11039 [Fontibacillus phaseoli]
MNYEELYRKELELKSFHNPCSYIRQIRNECRERRMTYRIRKKKKTWLARFMGRMTVSKND